MTFTTRINLLPFILIAIALVFFAGAHLTRANVYAFSAFVLLGFAALGAVVLLLPMGAVKDMDDYEKAVSASHKSLMAGILAGAVALYIMLRMQPEALRFAVIASASIGAAVHWCGTKCLILIRKPRKAAKAGGNAQPEAGDSGCDLNKEAPAGP